MKQDSYLQDIPVMTRDMWTPDLGTAIVNTAPRNHPGKHWIAICKCDRTYYYFDSSGNPPSKHDFSFGGGHVLHNIQRWQPLGTKTCGLYCLLFLWYARRGLLESFISRYNRDLAQNDLNTKMFVNRHLVYSLICKLLVKFDQL